MTEIETIRKKLRRPMPKAAIKQHADNNRSSVNPNYVIERLNDVFGEDGWEAPCEVIENGAHIVVKCSFVARVPGTYSVIRRYTFGGNTNQDRGDAYKGACTDAITKAASQIGIAGAVYKGQYDVESAPQAKPVSPAQLITTLELNALWNAAKKTGKTSGVIAEHLAPFGVKTFSDLPKQYYPQVLAWVLEAAA